MALVTFHQLSLNSSFINRSSSPDAGYVISFEMNSFFAVQIGNEHILQQRVLGSCKTLTLFLVAPRASLHLSERIFSTNLYSFSQTTQKVKKRFTLTTVLVDRFEEKIGSSSTHNKQSIIIMTAYTLHRDLQTGNG